MAGAKNGVFNFEGGCYAKTINLSRRSRAGNLLHNQRFGTVLENVSSMKPACPISTTAR
jgi:phosphoenolpyruvate carboxykinase (ATP)